MDNTTVNGIVLNDSISNCLLKLQNNRAASLAELLDDSIGFLLEYSGYFYDNSKTFLDVLATLHNARTEFLGLIPNQRRCPMKKPIGFRSYQNDEEPDKRDELEKQQAERQKAIANFIGQNYSPIGTTSQKCYKTTAELVYELSNIVDAAPMALAKQLADAGYHVEYLAGQPYWVMYERA